MKPKPSRTELLAWILTAPAALGVASWLLVWIFFLQGISAMPWATVIFLITVGTTVLLGLFTSPAAMILVKRKHRSIRAADSIYILNGFWALLCLAALGTRLFEYL